MIAEFEGRRGVYKLRLAAPEDAAILARHRAFMFRDMQEANGPLVAIIENASEDHLGALIEAREYFGFLAENHGEVAGGGGVWLRPLLPRPGAPQGGFEAYVLNVYTEPEYRRDGVARAIMGAIIQWSRERRVARITLHASPQGRGLYESLGFEASNEMRLRVD